MVIILKLCVTHMYAGLNNGSYFHHLFNIERRNFRNMLMYINK